MDNVTESLKEKNWQFWLRMALRFICGGILLVYAVFRIAIPVIDRQPVYLDKNDGYIIIGSIAIYLAVEAVRAAVIVFTNKKLGG